MVVILLGVWLRDRMRVVDQLRAVGFGLGVEQAAKSVRRGKRNGAEDAKVRNGL
jgi:hypothetical protein